MAPTKTPRMAWPVAIPQISPAMIATKRKKPPAWGFRVAPYIAGRTALADASELMDRYGDNAGLEAAVRAEVSRDAGNVLKFCHWRQIERVIATLSTAEVRGSVH
jgi:hypothetical protein